MTLGRNAVMLVAFPLFLLATNAMAQAPAAPPPVPADVSPLYVITYVESRPSARNDAQALLKSYRDANRAAAGNLRTTTARRLPAAARLASR